MIAAPGCPYRWSDPLGRTRTAAIDLPASRHASPRFGGAGVDGGPGLDWQAWIGDGMDGDSEMMDVDSA
jgi:hypothetical protein